MIEELKQWGCAVDDALGRVLNDEEFYRECLLSILNDDCFAQLGQALETHDRQAAFDAAHTLKGVLANLGLTPMCRTTVEIVEPLRAGNDAGLMGKYSELLRQKEHLAEILRQS